MPWVGGVIGAISSKAAERKRLRTSERPENRIGAAFKTRGRPPGIAARDVGQAKTSGNVAYIASFRTAPSDYSNACLGPKKKFKVRWILGPRGRQAGGTVRLVRSVTGGESETAQELPAGVRV